MPHATPSGSSYVPKRTSSVHSSETLGLDLPQQHKQQPQKAVEHLRHRQHLEGLMENDGKLSDMALRRTRRSIIHTSVR
jgi:hypothetical protein